MAAADPTLTLRLRITGRVQGVGYRAWAEQTAQKLGLRGWVRNLTDGSVEALAQGPEKDVKTFAAACQSGPTFARVAYVQSLPAEAFAGSGFAQAPTADRS